MSAYIICKKCKVAAKDDDGKNSELFLYGHAEHGQIEYAAEVTFFADHLTRGFVDLDRPALRGLPMTLGVAPAITDQRPTPFGKPASRDLLAATQHALRVQAQRRQAEIAPKRWFTWLWPRFSPFRGIFARFRRKCG